MQGKASLWTPRGFFHAVIGPFVDFFGKYKPVGLLMLLAVALYRLPDFVMGPLYNPDYHALGLAKDTVAAVRSSAGLAAALAGIAPGRMNALRSCWLPTPLL